MRSIPLAVFAMLAALPLAVRAQTAIPETIITATRIPTPAERVPAAVTVITRQQIEERGYQSLAEALAGVPGVHIVPSGGLGQQASGFLRGTNSGHTLVLLDGVPLNDASSPAGAYDFGQEMLGLVERIEVLRGPASSLYGSAAIGGTINLITRRAPADKGFAPFGDLAGGTQRSLRATLGAAGTVGQGDYLLGGQSYSTQGFSSLAPRLATNTGLRDGFRGYSGTGRLGWNPAEGTRVEGLLRWRQNNFGLPGTNDNFQLSSDPNYSGEDRRVTGQLRGETQLLNGRWTTGLRGFSTEDRRRYVNLPNSDAAGRANDLYRGSRQGLEWGNTLRLPALGPLADGALGFGVLHQLEQTNSYSGSGTRVSAQQHATSGFASLQYRAWERLDLTGGLRHDAIGAFTNATTWRLGSTLALPELNSRLRISGGTGYRTPSLYERFVTSSSFIGNSALKPERSKGWEIGTDTDLTLFGQQRFATASWTFFQSAVDNLINVVRAPRPGFVFTSVNVDRANLQGAELGLTLRPVRWLETSAAWTITEAFDATTRQRLLRRPEHVLSLTARLAPLPGLVIAPTVLMTGRANDYQIDNGGNFGDRGRVGAGTVVNLTASYQVMPQVAVYAEGRNLGRSRWEPTSGYATPGRSLLVGTRFAL